MANFTVSGANAGGLIAQAILGTVGVFFGMLVVYKTGAIRVTPKFTRMLVAMHDRRAGADAGQLLFSMFGSHDGGPLRNGGTMAIIFSLVMIALAAFSFLIDFDSADQMIRAGAPEKAAWGVALGLTVTLVWLYLEILRLLSYFRQRLGSPLQRESPASAGLLRVAPTHRLCGPDRHFVHSPRSGRRLDEGDRPDDVAVLGGPFIGAEAVGNGLVRKHELGFDVW